MIEQGHVDEIVNYVLLSKKKNCFWLLIFEAALVIVAVVKIRDIPK